MTLNRNALGKSQDEEKPAHEAFVLSAILYARLSDRSFSSPESRQGPSHVAKMLWGRKI